jgi:hypothetical protein
VSGRDAGAGGGAGAAELEEDEDEHVVGECAEPVCPRRASERGRSLSPATARGRRSSGR